MSATEKRGIQRIMSLDDAEAQRLAFVKFGAELDALGRKRIKGNDMAIRAVQIIKNEVEPQYVNPEDPSNKVIRPMTFKYGDELTAPKLDSFLKGLRFVGAENGLILPDVSIHEVDETPITWATYEPSGAHITASVVSTEHEEHQRIRRLYPEIRKNIGDMAIFQLVRPGDGIF